MPGTRARVASSHEVPTMGTYTLTDEQATALAAFGIIPVPAAPATASRPVAPSIASPFTAATATASGPVAYARRTWPDDMAAQRAYIAAERVPLHACSVDAVATLADGTTTTGSLHGFTTSKDAGAPCPGVRGLPKGTACPGTILA